jgi:hypothetical protein
MVVVIYTNMKTKTEVKAERVKKYEVIEQMFYDERLFRIKDISTGKFYLVDLYTDGAFPPTKDADKISK